ncbi:hypothetical protein AB0C96_03160 [Streptomyces sp. NPDC048506]|uniref:hypothetical protein n=1 Tax=Streptomyces sp. NPDC048506 TaxID=3155028 RepID=UPI0034180CC9
MRFAHKAVTAVGAGLMAGALLSAPSAHAAASPIQASVHTVVSDEFQLCGHNQYGQPVCTGVIASPNDWKRVYGWWWVGWVDFYGTQYHSDGSVSKRHRSCNSGKHRHGSFFACYGV